MRNTCGEWRKRNGSKPTIEERNRNRKPVVWTTTSQGRLANGNAKLIIVAANCPEDYTTALRAAHPEVSMHRARMVNRELGIACAKPFSVSTITVLDAGDSDLMALESNLE